MYCPESLWETTPTTLGRNYTQNFRQRSEQPKERTNHAFKFSANNQSFLKKKKIHFLPPSVSRYDLGHLNYIPHHKNFLAFEKIQDGLSAHCSIRKEQQGLRYNIQEKILWYYQWENQPVFSLACVSYQNQWEVPVALALSPESFLQLMPMTLLSAKSTNKYILYRIPCICQIVSAAKIHVLYFLQEDGTSTAFMIAHPNFIPSFFSFLNLFWIRAEVCLSFCCIHLHNQPVPHPFTPSILTQLHLQEFSLFWIRIVTFAFPYQNDCLTGSLCQRELCPQVIE